MGLLGTLLPANTVDTIDVLTRTARGHGLRAAARLASQPSGGERLAAAHCELAEMLARVLHVDADLVVAVGESYERYDGRGAPRKKRGDQATLASRIVRVALRFVVHRHLEGATGAAQTIERLKGGELDPTICDAAIRTPELGGDLAAASVWDPFLAAEPAPSRRLPASAAHDLALAFAHAADVKSRFTVGHSLAVAHLCEIAAPAMRLSQDETTALQSAALLHDLGRLGVPNGIWDKPGALNVVERDRMMSHAHLTERVLRVATWTRGLASIASMDHERVDGSGYPRASSDSSKSARLLAAADVMCALREPRPHRPAFASDAAARVLVDEAKVGRLDRACVEAVLAAVGERKQARVRGELPARLSDREVEVLSALAQGLSSKEIARKLFISAKTVQHHITHIYEKTGVSTRAAAAVFALENGLLEK